MAYITYICSSYYKVDICAEINLLMPRKIDVSTGIQTM